MNQFLASAILAAVVLAIVYLFMRLMNMEKEIKSLRNRAPPIDLAQAVWGMASESPDAEMQPFMFDPKVQAHNEVLLEEEEEDDDEIVETLSENPSPLDQPPLEQPPLEQPPLEQPLEQPPLELPPLELPPLEQPPLEQPPLEQPPPRRQTGAPRRKKPAGMIELAEK